MTNNHLSLSIVAFILLLFFFLFSWSAIAETGVCSSLAVPSGYKCEEFDVKTEDGYILKMQRIPSVADQPGTPVLLQHGVLADGMVWQLNSPGEALAFVLADAGYDVWIANTRGTRWSRRHEILDPSSRAFWAWSWDELVTYDLPATVEFVYKQTGQKLHFVGHSQGTLIALAALSEGGLGEKLISAVMLSPIGFLTHMKTKLGVLAAKSFLGEIYAWLGIAEFDPAGSSVKNLMKKLCRNPTVNCYDLFSAFTGKNCCLNESTIELYLQYEPQSTSTRNMVHLAQNFRAGAPTKFDYGGGENLRRYGRLTPPPYNFSKIRGDLPLFISYGGKDSLSDVEDVRDLVNELTAGNVSLVVQYVGDFAHADFVMGTAAKSVIYDAVVDFFRRHS